MDGSTDLRSANAVLRWRRFSIARMAKARVHRATEQNGEHHLQNHDEAKDDRIWLRKEPPVTPKSDVCTLSTTLKMGLSVRMLRKVLWTMPIASTSSRCGRGPGRDGGLDHRTARY